MKPLRIAVIAPPWIPVPPPAYGGIEAVVALLCDELTARRHDVTLFAAPGSRSAARVCTPLETAHGEQIGAACVEADYVGSIYDMVDRAAGDGEPFDVIHDHSGHTALAMAQRVTPPLVHTLHGAFDEHTRPFYERHGHKGRLVAISDSQLRAAPRDVQVAATVFNPMLIEEWPLHEHKEDYLLWIGRMDPVKGAHRAIAAAAQARARLVLAGPVQPGQEEYFAREVEPRVDGRQVVYIGEVGGEQRKQLFARARALLMPIRWREPFGLVMTEALACGTPVLAFPEGAASELVLDGETGYLVANELEMAEALGGLEQIDPRRCREDIARRCSVASAAEGYEAVYGAAIAGEATNAQPWVRSRAHRQREAAGHTSGARARPLLAT